MDNQNNQNKTDIHPGCDNSYTWGWSITDPDDPFGMPIADMLGTMESFAAYAATNLIPGIYRVSVISDDNVCYVYKMHIGLNAVLFGIIRDGSEEYIQTYPIRSNHSNTFTQDEIDKWN